MRDRVSAENTETLYFLAEDTPFNIRHGSLVRARAARAWPRASRRTRERTRTMDLKISAALSAAIAAAAGCLLAGSAGAMSPAGEEAMNTAGHVMFDHRCRSCHADDPAKQSYGPSLIGIVGRKAGTVEGFAYSEAMKSSGIVWDEDQLRKWIADNTSILPGTRMKHINISDKNEQDFLLSYLKSLK